VLHGGLQTYVELQKLVLQPNRLHFAKGTKVAILDHLSAQKVVIVDRTFSEEDLSSCFHMSA
jgi:hypothetical protein